MMRYSVFNAAQTNIGAAESAQHAGDIACKWLADHPAELFAYSFDCTPGYVYPFTRWTRGESIPHYIGTPYKTLRQCMADDDGAGYHVETYGGGVFTAVAWYASKPDAMRERERILAAGAWRGMPPRVVAGAKGRG